MIKENEVLLSSCEDFEDYCLRTFDVFLGGDVFPYRLSDTYRLVYDSWEEAVQELMAHGIEGFSYQRDEEVDDYLMCMQGFTQHVLMHDTTLQLVAQFCNTTYKLLMYNFDVPIRFETRIVKGEDGRLKIEAVPMGEFRPKYGGSCYHGFEAANGDIAAKAQFDRFLQKSGFTWRTAEIAKAFDMPEEGLVGILEQNGVEPKEAWTYKDFLFVYLLLTKDLKLKYDA